jgi:hypothetical protein
MVLLVTTHVTPPNPQTTHTYIKLTCSCDGQVVEYEISSMSHRHRDVYLRLPTDITVSRLLAEPADFLVDAATVLKFRVDSELRSQLIVMQTGGQGITGGDTGGEEQEERAGADPAAFGEGGGTGEGGGAFIEEEEERAGADPAAVGEGGGTGEGGGAFIEEPAMKDMSVIGIWKIENLILFCALAYRLAGGGTAGHEIRQPNNPKHRDERLAKENKFNNEARTRAAHDPRIGAHYTIKTTKPTKDETLLILQDLVGGDTTVWQEFLDNKALQYNFQDSVPGDDFSSHNKKHIRRHAIGLLFVAAHLRAAKNCAHTVNPNRGIARRGCSWNFYMGMMTHAYLNPGAGQAHIGQSLAYTVTPDDSYALSGWNLDHGTYDVIDDGSDDWRLTSPSGPCHGPRQYFTYHPLGAAFNETFWRLTVLCKNCDLKLNATHAQVTAMNQLAAGSTWI